MSPNDMVVGGELATAFANADNITLLNWLVICYPRSDIAFEVAVCGVEVVAARLSPPEMVKVWNRTLHGK